jgi:hypothetical protein
MFMPARPAFHIVHDQAECSGSEARIATCHPGVRRCPRKSRLRRAGMASTALIQMTYNHGIASIQVLNTDASA